MNDRGGEASRRHKLSRRITMVKVEGGGCCNHGFFSAFALFGPLLRSPVKKIKDKCFWELWGMWLNCHSFLLCHARSHTYTVHSYFYFQHIYGSHTHQAAHALRSHNTSHHWANNSLFYVTFFTFFCLMLDFGFQNYISTQFVSFFKVLYS